MKNIGLVSTSKQIPTGSHRPAQGNALGLGISRFTRTLKGRDIALPNFQPLHSYSYVFILIFMPQSLSKLAVHLIYSTKNRYPYFQNPTWQQHCTAYQAGIYKHLGCPALKSQVMPDHVHCLFLLNRTLSISQVVQEVKRDSSKWIKQQSAAWQQPDLNQFAWQRGYGAFAVSESNIDSVIHYIEHQQEHHRQRSFQEEYRLFLRRHGLEMDERYVWD